MCCHPSTELDDAVIIKVKPSFACNLYLHRSVMIVLVSSGTIEEVTQRKILNIYIFGLKKNYLLEGRRNIVFLSIIILISQTLLMFRLKIMLHTGLPIEKKK